MRVPTHHSSSPTPPDGYAVRNATADDARTIAELINAVNVAEVGTPWTSEDEVRGDLTSPRRRPGEDVVLVEDAQRIVGYLGVWPDADPFTRVTQLAFVHPSLWRRGLSAWLLRFGERMVRDRLARSGERAAIALRVARWSSNEAAGRLFDVLGYARVRSFLELRAELIDPPVAPSTPHGIQIRPFDARRDTETTYAALKEAFADHWGRSFEPMDEWVYSLIQREGSGFDPSLWFVAVEGAEIVGALCSREQDPASDDAAYVHLLGVRRSWRKRGVARALLLTAFGELHRRGRAAVELGVDAESPTGAAHLYASVGMRVVRSSEHWEKQVVDGRDDGDRADVR